MKSKHIAALVASAGLIWGTAHAAPDIANIAPDQPEVIILELQPMPGVQPGSEQEQAILGMLLLQLLNAMQAVGDGIEVQLATPPQGQSI